MLKYCHQGIQEDKEMKKYIKDMIKALNKKSEIQIVLADRKNYRI